MMRISFVAGESCVSGAIPAELSQGTVCSVYIENSTQSDLLELSISRTFRTGGEIRLRRRLDPEPCPPAKRWNEASGKVMIRGAARGCAGSGRSLSFLLRVLSLWSGDVPADICLRIRPEC
ncbi:hypothetical protein ACFQ40_13150 [Kroppenstedtia eburnea]|uniref:hypothetical protein n=1 Tax=Kroppenstedtia eburnea TaxID=714067 RepID=UPI003628AB9A